MLLLHCLLQTVLVICLSVCLCVCLLDTLVSPAKTAQQIEMQFGFGLVGPRNHVLDAGLDPPWKGAHQGDVLGMLDGLYLLYLTLFAKAAHGDANRCHYCDILWSMGQQICLRCERTQVRISLQSVVLSRWLLRYAALGVGCAILQCLGQLSLASLWVAKSSIPASTGVMERMSPHPKCVATVPCEISVFKKSPFLKE